MSIINRLPRLTWILVLPLMFIGGSAPATETMTTSLKKQIVHGTACQFTDPIDRTKLFAQMSPTRGIGIIQPTNEEQDVQVSCPLVRTNYKNLNGLNDIDVRLIGSDPTTNGLVICHARSLNEKGVILKEVRKEVRVIGNTTLYKLDWNTELNKSDAANSSYSLECNMATNIFLLQVMFAEYL